uniref:DNA-directed RNA polymerase n=2 Tax=Cacopsylla melanoneura TaxID=428564 RepID=A0A8D9EN90_9HEMI
MEDAMILNKSSYERGFAHGCIFKSMFIELEGSKDYFERDPNNKQIEDKLGPDGLVYVGAKLKSRDPMYCYWKDSENKYIVCRYSGKEEMTVEVVRMSSGFTSGGSVTPNCAYVGYRIQRNPSVGDKFASRAGQKGICSVRWPAEDLPFTDSGLVPDIVFNPHGFPSRMTIAMMVECMAGKSAAVHGLVHDATPFKFTEDNTAIDYFGKLLEAGGYNYYGTETMYSGVDGSMMQAQIFFGVVHYQRLRHMVSDKWQVRSKGPVDKVTHQPVKGRKRGGGVRFGEMERDGVLAHGASWVLLDRLFNSSDKSKELVCRTCGSLLGPTVLVQSLSIKNKMADNQPVSCKQCGERDNLGTINIPFVLRNLVCQLASFNIKVELDLKPNESLV